MRARLVLPLLTIVLACAGTEAEEDYPPHGMEEIEAPVGFEKSELSARVSGPWRIPASTRAIGDRQDVEYVGAGAWIGTRGCSSGLTSGARALRDDLVDLFPQTIGIGGFACRPIRGSTTRMSVHGTGRALDIHIATLAGDADNGEGDPVGNWLIENAEQIGVQYIIWDRWTWRADRPDGSKDRSYGGTHPHHDHLHIELSLDAAAQRTPYFNAPVCGDNVCGGAESCGSCSSDCGVCGPFEDVAADHPFVRGITWMKDERITRGCTSDGSRFCPDDAMTRAQLATFFVRAFDLSPSNTNAFDDDDNSAHEAAINALAAAGVTSGCGARRFCPDDYVKRDQIASFLARALSLPNVTRDFFSDDAGNTHESAINRIAAANITSGCGNGRYCPDRNVTRGQMATFLYRAICANGSCPAAPFADVPRSHPFAASIAWMKDQGITNGCNADGTRYCPDEPVRRDHMAAFLVRALSLPNTPTDHFADDEGSAFEDAINRLAAAGITSGCGASRYCPLDPVTREQMASFLARALHLPATSADYFTDDETSVHEGAINRIAEANITNGCGGTRYCPADEITRGQLAAFLHRALR
ncbi:MAG: S-layer homology domain-containing protein [Deltaproteobacteria bacterium]|jgi:hypothetical protein